MKLVQLEYKNIRVGSEGSDSNLPAKELSGLVARVLTRTCQL